MNGISLHRVEELNALMHPECVVAGSLTSNTATHAPTHLGQYAQDRVWEVGLLVPWPAKWAAQDLGFRSGNVMQ